MIQIVPFSEEYIASVANLEKECFNEPFSSNMLSSSLGDSTIVSFVALDEGNVCGFIEAQNICDDYYNINTIETSENYRRQGIAQMLLEALLDRSQNLSITLEVRESNLAAISLYKKNGFVEIGLRKNYYHKPTENALILQREADSN